MVGRRGKGDTSPRPYPDNGNEVQGFSGMLAPDPYASPNGMYPPWSEHNNLPPNLIPLPFGHPNAPIRVSVPPQPPSDVIQTSTGRKKRTLSSDRRQSSNTPKHPKKISCGACRTRKIKCDGLKPVCGSCKKGGLPNSLCIYDNSPWVSTVVKEKQLKEEIEELKRKNETIKQQMKILKAEMTLLQNDNLKLGLDCAKVKPPENKFPIECFHKGSSDLVLNFPFKEEFNVLQKLEISNLLGSREPKLVGPTSWRTAISIDKKMKFIFEKISKSINTKLHAMQEDSSESPGETGSFDSFSFHPLSINSIKNERLTLSKKESIVKYLYQRLPNPAVFRLLFENFFEGTSIQLCPGMIDRHELFEDFEKTLGIDISDGRWLESLETPFEYRVSKIDDDLTFSKVARILMVAVTSLLFGLNTFGSSGPDTLTEKLSSFSSSSEIVKCFRSFQDQEHTRNLRNVAETLLTLGNVQKFPCIRAIQTLLLIHMNSLYGPSFCTELFDDLTSSVLGLACHMAMQLGLHKDIDILYEDLPMHIRKTLKATWLILLGYDGRRSLVTGLPLLINESYTYTYKSGQDEDYEPGDFETRERILITKSLLLSRGTMNEILREENKTALNLKLQIDKLTFYKNRYFLTSLSRHLECLKLSDLSESEFQLRLRQIKNILHLYSLQQSIHLMLYLTYDSDATPEFEPLKEKYCLLTLKISVLLILSVVQVGKTLLEICTRNNINRERLSYVLPVMKECEIKAALFILSIILRDLYKLKNMLENKPKTSISEIIHGSTVYDLTFEGLEDHFVNEEAEDLSKLAQIFTKDNTFITLKFLSDSLEEIWTTDATFIEMNPHFSLGLELIRDMFSHFVQTLQNFKFNTASQGTSKYDLDSTSHSSPSTIKSKNTIGHLKTGGWETHQPHQTVTGNSYQKPSERSSISSSSPSAAGNSAGFSEKTDIGSSQITNSYLVDSNVFQFAAFESSSHIPQETNVRSSLLSAELPDRTESEKLDVGDFLYDELDSLLTLDVEAFSSKFKNDILTKRKGKYNDKN